MTDWKQFCYKALKRFSRKEEQKSLAKELFFDGDFKYYADMKDLADDQKTFYKDLLSELKESSSRYRERLLLELIETENDIDELLQYVKKDPDYIERYAEQLIQYDEQFVIEIYIKHIEMGAAEASNRREYRFTCDKINRFAKIAGTERKQKVIVELKERYKRRPALVKELSKI